MRKLASVFGIMVLVLTCALFCGPVSWAAYVDNGDGTVTDDRTGRMWQQDAGPTKTWKDALSFCESSDLAGYHDWRLPTIRELKKIVDVSRYDPAIDPIFNCASSCYWSSSTYAGNTVRAWSVYFHSGYDLVYSKSTALYVRCVRAGSCGSFDYLTISGTVRTDVGTLLSGVTVSLSGAATKTATTDGKGSYSFSDLSNGAYTITPAKDQYTFTPAKRSVNINGSDLTGQDFVGTLQTGSLNVVIIPAAAVTAGAKWKVDNGAWSNSGVTVSGLTVGSHTVSFKDVPGWTTPAAQTVTIAGSQTTSATGAYSQSTGSLTVTITPQEAIDAGARWKVDNGAWNNSGVTLSGLAVGSHMVSFKDAPGWTTPATQTVTIAGSQTTSATGAYTQATGSLTVTITPQEAIDAGARWKVDNGAWNNSGVTISGLSVGSHTVSSKDAPGWTAPRDQSVSIQKNKTTTLTVKYNPATVQYALTLSKTGDGKGTIASSPEGIDCGTDCTELYNADQMVTLTATADADSTFTGWSGAACAGTGQCAVTMNADTTITAGFSLKSTVMPDLIVTSIAGPDTGIAGQSIRVFGTIKNRGNGPADASKTGVYLSADSAITPKDRQLTTIDQWEIAPGVGDDFSEEVVIPDTIKGGMYYIGAIADVKGSVAESNEANNSKAYGRRIKIVSPKADLVLQDVSSPDDTARMGASIKVYTTIVNQGQTAAGPFTVQLFLSKDAAVKVSDIFLRGYDLKGMSAGKSVRTPTTVTIPKTIQPGQYYLGAIADTSHKVDEGNKANNAQSSLKTILITK